MIDFEKQPNSPIPESLYIPAAGTFKIAKINDLNNCHYNKDITLKRDDCIDWANVQMLKPCCITLDMKTFPIEFEFLGQQWKFSSAVGDEAVFKKIEDSP